MKKIIILSISFAVLAAGLVLGYIEYNKTTMNSLLMANLEILAHAEDGDGGGDPGGGEQGGSGGWVRADSNCVYRFKGEAGGVVTVRIGGVNVIQLTVGADGYAEYSFEGKTTCASGGYEQCTARYCPQLSFM